MKITTAFLSAALLLFSGFALAAQDDKAAVADADVIAAQLPSYPLETCAVSGEGLGSMGEPIDMVVEGKLVRLCCKGCVKGVKKDPAAAIAKVDAAVVKAQGASYPLDTCVVSGEKLDAMGAPVDVVTGTRLVRVCCKGCIKKVKSDPKASLAKINAALIEAQRASYPLETCAISGEGLDAMGEPIEMLYGTQLVRLCCKGCIKGFKKNPKATLAKIAEAGKAKEASAKTKKG